MITFKSEVKVISHTIRASHNIDQKNIILRPNLFFTKAEESWMNVGSCGQGLGKHCS